MGAVRTRSIVTIKKYRGLLVTGEDLPEGVTQPSQSDSATQKSSSPVASETARG